MKDIRDIILIPLFILLATACGRERNKEQLPQLLQAESVMYEHPDSALHILQNIPAPDASDKAQKATWALLLTQAKYKNYVEELADTSLINIAYDYFMKKKDARRKATVLYYKGILCEKTYKGNEAQKLYLEAIEEVEKTKDYRLAHLIYGSIGNIYLYNHLYEYALQMFKQSLHYAQLSDNKDYICSVYYHLAKVYSVLSDWENSIKYYKEAIQMAETLHNDGILTNGMNELAGVYMDRKDYNHSLFYAQKALKLKETIELPLKKGLEQSFLVIGDIYRHINKSDSAYYYLDKALSANRIETVCAAYQALYYLSRNNKDFEKMSQYCDSMMVYQDSIEKLNRSKEFMNMQAKYDQQKVINEKNLLKIEKDGIILNISLALAALVCTIAVLVYIYQRKLLCKERTILRNEEEIRRNILQLHENETTIRRNQAQIAELQEQTAAAMKAHGQKEPSEQSETNEQETNELLSKEEQHFALIALQQQTEQLQTENQRLQQRIDSYRELPQKQEIETLRANAERARQLEERERVLTEELVNSNELMRRLREKPKFLEETDWQKLHSLTDRVYNDFTQRLSTQFSNVTEVDIQLCILIKLHFTVSQIAVFTAVSPGTVSVQKQRLKKRILQADEPLLKVGQTLDMWIWEY